MPKLFSPEIEKEICQRYKAGGSSVRLAKTFLCSPGTICNILQRNGIPRIYQARSRYELQNPRFFRIIDSESNAYWLGLIAADGYISPKENKLSLKQKWEDKGQLISFRDALGSTHPIYERNYQGRHYGEISFFHFNLIQDLLKFPGFGNRKTWELRWPENIPSKLLNHYIRGYMDGDGGFYVQKRNRPSPGVSFQVTSNRKFLLKMQDELIKNCDLRKNKLQEFSHSDACRLIYAGRRQILRIFNFIYQDATIWLARKREKIEPHLSPPHSNIRLISFQGKTQSITEWASEVGLKRDTLNMRIWRGWPVERALTTPLG